MKINLKKLVVILKSSSKIKSNKVITILILILAGESVFILPFVLQRIFRPTFLDVFNISNTELGLCFSIYGIVAMASYPFGGAFADRFHPKVLMSAGLIMTALGGFYFATYPSYLNLTFLYGYWGFTTIFMFWAAMIKATRIWGGKSMQGRAFGFLDGGRGLVAASFGLLGVVIFSQFLVSDIATASLDERKYAFRLVIIISSGIIMFVGLLTYLFLGKLKTENYEGYQRQIFTLIGFKQVIKLPSVWLLMIIIMSAYVGYKLTDDISLYANEVMGYDEVKSAKIGTYMLYLRPFIGVLIGFLADRTRASLWIIIGFGIALISSILFSSGIINGDTTLFISAVTMMAVGVYAARVLYFAVLNEGHIPLALTGTAVGLISLIGYTPDIFVGPIMGILLDNNPGEFGHKLVFMFFAAFSILGMIASYLFYRYSKKMSKIQ